MDSLTLLTAILTVTLCAVTWHARRLGNDSRDVRLLGTLAGLSGMGTAVSGFA